MSVRQAAKVIRNTTFPCTSPEGVVEILRGAPGRKMSYKDLLERVPGGTSLLMVLYSLEDQRWVTLNKDWKKLDEIIVTLVKK